MTRTLTELRQGGSAIEPLLAIYGSKEGGGVRGITGLYFLVSYWCVCLSLGSESLTSTVVSTYKEGGNTTTLD